MCLIARKPHAVHAFRCHVLAVGQQRLTDQLRKHINGSYLALKPSGCFWFHFNPLVFDVSKVQSARPELQISYGSVTDDFMRSLTTLNLATTASPKSIPSLAASKSA